MLSSLSSYFELLAALNAAFIVSDQFGKKLFLNVFSLWPNRVKTAFTQCDEWAKNIRVQLQNVPQRSRPVFGQEQGQIATRLKSLKSEFFKLQKEMDQTKFNFVSTCAFFYCLAVLLFIGFGFDCNLVPHAKAVIWCNYISLFSILMYVLLKTGTAIYSPTHFKCALLVIIVIILCTTVNFIWPQEQYDDCSQHPNLENYWLMLNFKLSFALWPIAHFGLNICEVRIKAIKKLDSVHKDLEQVKKDFEALSNKIIGSVMTNP